MDRFIFSCFAIVFIPTFLYCFQAELLNEKNLNFQTVSSVQLNGIGYTYQDATGIVWLGTGRDLFRLTSSDLISLKTLSPKWVVKSPVNNMIWLNNERFISEVSSNCIQQISNDYKQVKRICLSATEVICEIRKYNNEIYILSKNRKDEIKISILEDERLVKILDLPFKDLKIPNFLFFEDKILILTSNFLRLLDLSGKTLSNINFSASKNFVYQEVGKHMVTNGIDIFMSHPSLTSLSKIEITNNNLSLDTYQTLSNNIPLKLDTDQKGNFIVNWINPKGFVHFISLIYKNDICNPKLVEIKDNSLYSAGSEDINSKIFLGCYYGLRTLEVRKNIFNNILNKTIKNSSYLEDGFSMRGINQIGDKLYMAREISNLYRLDLKTNLLDTLYVRDSLGEVIDLKMVNNLIYLRSENKLLFSTSNDNNISFLVLYDPVSEKSEFITFEGRIVSLSYDEKDKILAIGFNKIIKGNSVLLYDLQKKQLINTKWKTNEVENYVKIIDSLVFCGSRSGLRIFHVGNSVVDAKLKKFASGLSNLGIYFIDKISKYIMIGTALDGLKVYDLETNLVRSIDNSLGLQYSTVPAVLEDSQGRFWISTYNGLFVFNSNFDLLKKYGSQDGLNHVEFNRYSNFKRSDTLYFGGINGVTQVYVPKKMELYNYGINSLGLITNCYDDLDKRQKQEYFDLLPKEIIFLQYQTSPKIRFTDGHFGEEKISYRVKLMGKDKEWRYPDQQNDFTFPDIEVGKFTLLIERRIQGSQWRNINTETTIFFQQRFVKSRLFIILIITGLVTSIFLYLHNLYRRKLDYNLLRESIASDLHDELGSALTSISMQARFINHDSTDDDIEAFVLENQSALQLVRDTIWSVNPDNDDVQSLIDRCSDIALRILNKINIPYIIDSQLDGKKVLQIDTRKEIYLIFKEAITNISKHSNSTETHITFRQDATHFEMKIINNGAHSDNTLGGLNMGIQNMKQRAEKINGRLEYEKNGEIFSIILNTPRLY